MFEFSHTVKEVRAVETSCVDTDVCKIANFTVLTIRCLHRNISLNEKMFCFIGQCLSYPGIFVFYQKSISLERFFGRENKKTKKKNKKLIYQTFAQNRVSR